MQGLENAKRLSSSQGTRLYLKWKHCQLCLGTNKTIITRTEYSPSIMDPKTNAFWFPQICSGHSQYQQNMHTCLNQYIDGQSYSANVSLSPNRAFTIFKHEMRTYHIGNVDHLEQIRLEGIILSTMNNLNDGLDHNCLQ